MLLWYITMSALKSLKLYKGNSVYVVVVYYHVGTLKSLNKLYKGNPVYVVVVYYHVGTLKFLNKLYKGNPVYVVVVYYHVVIEVSQQTL